VLRNPNLRMLDTKQQIDQLTDREAYLLSFFQSKEWLSEAEMLKACCPLMMRETAKRLLASLEEQQFITSSLLQSANADPEDKTQTFNLTPTGMLAFRQWQDKAAYFAVGRCPDQRRTKERSIFFIKLFKRSNVVLLGFVLLFMAQMLLMRGNAALLRVAIPIVLITSVAFILSRIDHFMFKLYTFVVRFILCEERQRQEA
jgi:hypothetical protein